MEGPLRRRLAALIILRLVISTALLGAAALLQPRPAAGPGPWPLYALIGVTFALSALYATVLRPSERRRWPLDLQLVADAATVAAFVWFTGGVTSYFSSLFVLPIVAASILQHRRAAALVAVLSALLYAGQVILQYTRAGTGASAWVPQTGPLPAVDITLLTVAVNAVGFLAVGALAGVLTERLRRRDQELEHASAEIANLQAFSQHIISSLSMGLVTTDAAGRILTFNRAAESITGRRAASAIGARASEVLQLPAEFAARLESDPDFASSRRADYRYRHADGHEIDLGLAAAPFLTLTAGTPAGVLYTFQDVTTLRRLERDARMQQRLAAVGEMAAGLAHEIRNPLASMSGSIQLLRQELRLSDEQAQLMDIVLRESGRLNQTIDHFLTYARPQRFSVTRIDLRRAVADTALLLRNGAEVRPGHVIDVDLPQAPVWCDADEGQVRQVVWNLATNGLRAMPERGRLYLAAREGPTGDEAVLEVRDEGVGIPEEHLEAIFQPFYGTFTSGTGLGMAIVHRIVSDYGGEIQVTSSPGAGTTVLVRLPARALPTAA